MTKDVFIELANIGTVSGYVKNTPIAELQKLAQKKRLLLDIELRTPKYLYYLVITDATEEVKDKVYTAYIAQSSQKIQITIVGKSVKKLESI